MVLSFSKYNHHGSVLMEKDLMLKIIRATLVNGGDVADVVMAQKRLEQLEEV